MALENWSNRKLSGKPANAADPLFENMTKVTALPDQIDFDLAADENLLEAALRSGVPDDPHLDTPGEGSDVLALYDDDGKDDLPAGGMVEENTE